MSDKSLLEVMKYFKTFGFTKKGRRFWYEQNKERLRNNDEELARKLSQPLLADFVLNEASELSFQVHSSKRNEYLTPELQKLSACNRRSNIAWLAGTGIYTQ